MLTAVDTTVPHAPRHNSTSRGLHWTLCLNTQSQQSGLGYKIFRWIYYKTSLRKQAYVDWWCKQASITQVSLLACFHPHCWGLAITLCPTISTVACPSLTVNTPPLFCLTSRWYHLSIFVSTCLVFSSHRVFFPVFRCTVFWLWPHGRNTGMCNAVLLSSGVSVPMIVLLAASMHRSDVPSGLPETH